jgi:hypothetical protein
MMTRRPWGVRIAVVVTAVRRLALAPIALDPVGVRSRLAPLIIDSEPPRWAITWRRLGPPRQGLRYTVTDRFRAATTDVAA